MPEFEYLFTPIAIGPRTVKNRICCSAHADGLAEDGMPAEREPAATTRRRPGGGVGFMMCFGSASVHPTSTARDWNGVELFDDRVIPHLRRVQRRPCTATTCRGRPDHPPRPPGPEHRPLEPDVRPQRRPRAQPPGEPAPARPGR